MSAWFRSQPVSVTPLKPIVERHLGIELAHAQSVTHALQPSEQVNLQKVIDRWASDQLPPAQPIGFVAGDGFFHDDTLVRALVLNKLIQAPVEREPLASGLRETFDGVARGMFFLKLGQSPIVAAFRSARMPFDFPMLEFIAATREAARSSLNAALDEAQKSNIYRGQPIVVERLSTGFAREGVTIRFYETRTTSRNEIILPEEVLQVIERNVFGMLKHAQAMQRAGRSLRRGLLFHGPPGTGKSLMVRYLIQECRDHTVVLLTRSQSLPIREACQIARLLAPSIVVLEDVDLIGEHRQTNQCPLPLHELLNEMDGIGPRDDVTFLLTTNRPDILEPALAARPGRVDQAIEFPLPNAECRSRLIRLFGCGLDLSQIDISKWVDHTAGTSPAFIEELVRKAALFAAERNGDSASLKLADQDIRCALDELVLFGGELTQRLLGYRPMKIGYHTSPAN